MEITLCIDGKQYTSKPLSSDAAWINASIGEKVKQVSLKELADCINNGQTFCPSVFNNQKKSQENFKQQQVFALDFDGGITMKEALERARQYEITPTITYETFSSMNCNKFRFLFCHCTSIPSAEVARTIQLALCSIFPEADKSSKDFTKLYYGGKNATVNNGAFFNAHTLLVSMTNRFNDADRNGHLQRLLHKFSRLTGLILEKGVFKIELSAANINGATPPSPDLQPKSGEFRACSIYIYMDSALKSPILLTLYYKTPMRGEREEAPAASAAVHGQKMKWVRDVNFQMLPQKCPLFEELVAGNRRLGHMELFGLLTNFVRIKGGQTELLKAMESYPDLYGRKILITKRDMDYAVKNNYKPMNCENYCPYTNNCNHGANILQTIKPPKHTIIKIDDKIPTLVSLEEACQDFNTKFYDIVSSDQAEISIIRAQTGIGKTHTYLDYMRTSNTPCIIAVPTNKLKDEVYNKALGTGISVIKTPSIEELKEILPFDVKEKIMYLYAIGNEEAVNFYLRECGKNKGLSIIREYFKELEKVYTFEGHIITTHAKLLHMKSDVLENRKIIIDEDIIKDIMKIESIPINAVRSFIHSQGIEFRIKKKLKIILSHCKQDKVYFSSPPMMFDLEARIDFFKRIEKMGIWIKNNILGLCRASTFYFDGKNIHYIHEQSLQDRFKYTILSATANQTIYEKFFHNSAVKFYQCKEAAYIGTVYEYHDQTYSRYCITNLSDFYEFLRKKHSELPVITFKNYDPYADEDDLHMGATEGHNHLEGKDIVVAGTPHKPEFVAKLFGMHLGIDIHDTLSTREISNNGYKFWFMTYANPSLRDIQLWIIESELEQCVGRARLLRYDATVHLYSNFPVRQCTLVSGDLNRELE